MAQTGYTPILLYSSSTASSQPAAANLTNSTLGSELAINISDGKLFYKDSAGDVQVIGWRIVPTTSGGTGLTTYAAGDMVYYASGTAFNKLAIGVVDSVMISTGTAPQWSTSLSLAGNLTFTTGSNRILGDFSNATKPTRVYFQTSTVNGNTSVGAIPNGTGTAGEFAALSNYDPTNSVLTQIIATSTESSLRSSVNGASGYVPLRIWTGGSQKITISTAGDVGIGVDPPAAKLDVNSLSWFRANSSGLNIDLLGRASDNKASIRFLSNSGLATYGSVLHDGTDLYLVNENSNAIYFYTGGSNLRMQIAGSGEVVIGGIAATEKLNVDGTGYVTGGMYIGTNASTNTLIDNASNGSGTATLYIGNASITTSSDRRLKRDIENSQIDALAKVKAMRVVDFTWDDPSDTAWNNRNARGRWTGLIAQEAIEQVPWAVNAPRDPSTMEPLPYAKNEAGNDRYWFMEYEHLVPLLIKGMQEQQSQIDALNAKLAALSGD